MKKWGVIGFLTGVILLLLVAGIFIPSVSVISLSNRKQPSERFYQSTNGVGTFIISYTHSVNKGRVHDFYTWNKDSVLCMEQTEFVSYGAGIPEPEETPGATFLVTDSGYFIQGINRNVEKLVMAVGLIANHSIAFASQVTTTSDLNEVFLTDLFAAQTSIIVEIKRVSLLEYIFHKI